MNDFAAGWQARARGPPIRPFILKNMENHEDDRKNWGNVTVTFPGKGPQMGYEQLKVEDTGFVWKNMAPNPAPAPGPGPLPTNMAYTRKSDFIRVVKQRVSIPWYMETYHHAEFVRHGSKGKLHWKEHPSFVYSPDVRLFIWNSHAFGGSIIDLVKYMEQLDEAGTYRRLREILCVADGAGQATALPGAQQPAAPEEPGTLVLPTRDDGNWKRVYAYLCKARGIEKAVVDWLRIQGILYPTKYNLCYCTWLDGAAVYVCEKGLTQKFWVHVPKASDCRRFMFNWNGRTKRLIVTESFVDALSCATLIYRKHGEAWLDYAYLSLECCVAEPLIKWISEKPKIEKIYLAQDNDQGGMRSRDECVQSLREAGYGGEILQLIPPTDTGKDWNEYITGTALDAFSRKEQYQ